MPTDHGHLHPGRCGFKHMKLRRNLNRSTVFANCMWRRTILSLNWITWHNHVCVGKYCASPHTICDWLDSNLSKVWRSQTQQAENKCFSQWLIVHLNSNWNNLLEPSGNLFDIRSHLVEQKWSLAHKFTHAKAREIGLRPLNVEKQGQPFSRKSKWKALAGWINFNTYLNVTFRCWSNSFI